VVKLADEGFLSPDPPSATNVLPGYGVIFCWLACAYSPMRFKDESLDSFFFIFLDFLIEVRQIS